MDKSDSLAYAAFQLAGIQIQIYEKICADFMALGQVQCRCVAPACFAESMDIIEAGLFVSPGPSLESIPYVLRCFSHGRNLGKAGIDKSGRRKIACCRAGQKLS